MTWGALTRLIILSSERSRLAGLTEMVGNDLHSEDDAAGCAGGVGEVPWCLGIVLSETWQLM